MDTLGLAVVQMKSDENTEGNLNQIIALWDSVNNKKEIHGLCLPENSLYNKVKNSSRGLTIDGPAIQKIQNLAVSNNIFINLGAIPLKESHGISNATVLITAAGKVEVVYRKIHLFDLDMGSLKIRESEQFVAGNKTSLLDINSWKMGFSICYDVRFSELYLAYAKLGAEVIFVPSAFTRTTGRAHWETLLRARAIECQSYIIAPAQTGVVKVEEESRASYGHTMVVDPWGKVLLNLEGESPEIAIVSLSKKLVSKTKKQMPMNEHRKL